MYHIYQHCCCLLSRSLLCTTNLLLLLQSSKTFYKDDIGQVLELFWKIRAHSVFWCSNNHDRMATHFVYSTMGTSRDNLVPLSHVTWDWFPPFHSLQWRLTPLNINANPKFLPDSFLRFMTNYFQGMKEKGFLKFLLRSNRARSSHWTGWYFKSD